MHVCLVNEPVQTLKIFFTWHSHLKGPIFKATNKTTAKTHVDFFMVLVNSGCLLRNSVFCKKTRIPVFNQKVSLLLKSHFLLFVFFNFVASKAIQSLGLGLGIKNMKNIERWTTSRSSSAELYVLAANNTDCDRSVCCPFQRRICWFKEILVLKENDWSKAGTDLKSLF